MAKFRRRNFLTRSAQLVAAIGLWSFLGPSARASVTNPKGMIHYVLFWLKNPEDPEARKTMEAGLKKLVTIKTIKSSYLGTPAGTPERDVVDQSFTYSLMVSFEDIAAHDSYQDDPIHLEFVETCADLWESVKVFDSKNL